jgi:transposase-like protein
MGSRSDDQIGRSYAPKGQTPVVDATGKRFGCSMISALSNLGDLTFPKFSGRGWKDSPMYRRYARELKDQACALVISEGYDPANAGWQLGIPEMTLRGWLTKRNWKGVRTMPDTDDPKILKARIRELEARLKRVEMEREILKKATAYFASPHLSASNGFTITKESSK